MISFFDDEPDFDVAELSIAREVERQAKAAMEAPLDDVDEPEPESERELEPESEPELEPASEPASEPEPEPEPEPDADEHEREEAAPIAAPSQNQAGSNRAVAILAQLAAQMRQDKTEDESVEPEPKRGSLPPDTIISDDDDDSDVEKRRRQAVRKAGLLDAAIFGKRLKDPAVKAVYAAGRRAGLVEAARSLRAVIEREEVSVADLFTLEEQIYAKAYAAKKNPDDSDS